MKVFVAGGTGFIGSYVVMDLLEHGHDIALFARNANKVSGFLNHEHINNVTVKMDGTETMRKGLWDMTHVSTRPFRGIAELRSKC
jgi:UDP-glucose 4-epimerase